MAACRPAGALLHAHGMIRAADAELSALHLLKMTFQTEVRVAGGEHLGVDRAVRAMTRRATFVHRFVLENVRAALRRMTIQTRRVLRFQSRAAAEMRRTFVGRMTFRASHFAFRHGMMARQTELPPHIAVTGEANRLDAARVGRGDVRAEVVRHRATRRKTVRRLRFSARFRVDAARSVTRFTTGVQYVWPAHREYGVICGLKRFVDFLMALLTFF